MYKTSIPRPMFFVFNKAVNGQMDHLMVSNRRRPLTVEEQQIPFGG